MWFVSCSLNCVDWFLLPPASDSVISEVSKAAKGRFIGDPSYVYEHSEVVRRGEGDEAQEEEIVVSVIKQIKSKGEALRVRVRTKGKTRMNEG